MDVNALIDEIAKRHHIRLASDDPICEVFTLVQLQQRAFAEQLEAMVKGVSDQVTDRLAAQIETSRIEIAKHDDGAQRIAEAMINAAAEWSAERLRDAARGAAEEIKAAADHSVAVAHEMTRSAVWIASVSGLVTVAAVVYAIVAGHGG